MLSTLTETVDSALPTDLPPHFKLLDYADNDASKVAEIISGATRRRAREEATLASYDRETVLDLVARVLVQGDQEALYLLVETIALYPEARDVVRLDLMSYL